MSRPSSSSLAPSLTPSSTRPEDAILGVLRNHRTQVRAFLDAGIDLQRLGLGDDVRNPFLRLAHQHGDRGRHAALAGGAEGGADQRVERLLLVGIGHHDGVILRAHHALHALAVLRGEVVDVRADGGRADEGHRHDVRDACTDASTARLPP